MSEDEIELRELITDKLNTTGFLYDIKAQIRAAVLHTLSQDGNHKFPVEKQKEHLAKYLNQNEGVVALSVVKEFLEKLNLKSTLSVLELETGIGNYKVKNRDSLMEEFGLCSTDIDPNDPIIFQYLKTSRNNSNSMENGNVEREIIRGSTKQTNISDQTSPKNKRILPQVQNNSSNKDNQESDDNSIEFSDILGLPDSQEQKLNDSKLNINPYQAPQRPESSKSSGNNEYSYEESFSSDTTKQNENDDSIKEIDIEEIDEKSDSKTGDVTIDSERSVSFDYMEVVKK